MGKGVVLENIGDGLYSVRVEFDTTRAENRIIALRDNVARTLAEISELDAEIEGVEDIVRIGELSTRRNILTAERLRLATTADNIARLLPGETIRQAWCADFSPELASGQTVGTVEVLGDIRTLQIQPGFEGSASYSPARDGVLIPPISLHPANTFLDSIFRPAWRRWKPMFRHGVLSNLDKEANTGTVTLAAAVSTRRLRPAEEGKAPINCNQADTTLDSVPIKYMDCDAQAFEDGDEVIVSFGFDWSTPKIIGFAHDPKACGGPFFLQIFLDDIPVSPGENIYCWTADLGPTPDKLTDADGYAGVFLPEETTPPPAYGYFQGQRSYIPIRDAEYNTITRDIGNGDESFPAYELRYVSYFVCVIRVNGGGVPRDENDFEIIAKNGETAGGYAVSDGRIVNVVQEGNESTAAFLASGLPGPAYGYWMGIRSEKMLYDCEVDPIGSLMTLPGGSGAVRVPIYYLDFIDQLFFVRILIDGAPDPDPQLLYIKHEGGITAGVPADTVGIHGPFDRGEIDGAIVYTLYRNKLGGDDKALLFSLERTFIDREVDGQTRKFPVYTVKMKSVFLYISIHLDVAQATVSTLLNLSNGSMVPIDGINYHICDGEWNPGGHPFPPDPPEIGYTYYDLVPINATVFGFLDTYFRRAWANDFAEWPSFVGDIGLASSSDTAGITDLSEQTCVFYGEGATQTSGCNTAECSDNDTYDIPLPVPPGFSTVRTRWRVVNCTWTSSAQKSGSWDAERNTFVPVWGITNSDRNLGAKKAWPTSEWGYDSIIDLVENEENRSKRWLVVSVNKYTDYSGDHPDNITTISERFYTITMHNDAEIVGSFDWLDVWEPGGKITRTGCGCCNRSWSFSGGIWVGIEAVLQESRRSSRENVFQDLSTESIGPISKTVKVYVASAEDAIENGHSGAVRAQWIESIVENLIQECYDLTLPNAGGDVTNISADLATNGMVIRTLGLERVAGCLPDPNAEAWQNLISDYRESIGLNRLACDSNLRSAANRMAQDVSQDPARALEAAETGVFDIGHVGSDGSTLLERAADAGYGIIGSTAVWGVGENIAFATPDKTLEQVLAGWLASPAHRANIIDPRWSEIGTATREGLVDGVLYNFEVHVFGSPPEYL